MAMRGGVYNYEIILGSLLLLWATDIGAYFAGTKFGRRKLFERVSPKKSWEGAVGGALSATLVESLFKRSIAIKDSGSTIPGHGGFLDRFDGLLLSAPFIVTFLKIFS